MYTPPNKIGYHHICLNFEGIQAQELGYSCVNMQYDELASLRVRPHHTPRLVTFGLRQ